MRLCRFLSNSRPAFAWYLDDDFVLPVAAACAALGRLVPNADSLLDLLPGGRAHHDLREIEARLTTDIIRDHRRTLADVQLLTPVAAPGKFICLAGNYADHVTEQGGQAEERARTFPYLFLKPPNTFAHPGGPIRIPAISPNKIDWEVELGVVIGKTCRDVSAADALNFIAGYTVVNDVSDRGFRPNPQRTTRPKDTFFDWQHGKWHDTFCPFGPCILSADECPDPQSLRLTLTVNETTEQNGTTAAMIFPVADIIAFVSSIMTLQPGDVISTGTPDGVGNAKGKFLKPGDRVTAWIENIGTLRNPVVAAEKLAVAR